ncbi:MAG TPA: glycosyl hydrolase family 28 protein [Verrucomicrobiae bacterium]|nr:glycosyl hydrolase family 28 protein [Verrucomicrobiae bacterium]
MCVKSWCLALALPFAPLCVSAITPWSSVINTNNVIVVTNAPYNAIGDGVFTNSDAISNAIVAASKGGTTNGLIGGTVEIPAPGIYLCGPLQLANNVNLQVDAGAALRMLPYGSYPLGPGGTNPPGFIAGNSLTNIAITGPGAIDGQGAPWWPGYKTNNRPIMISLSGCKYQWIHNITLSNSPEFHIALSSSKGNATVDGVIVRAPSSSDPVTPSHNTDACDVSGTNILVQNCNISTGDDDFTCGGGTHDVLLTNNTYGNGHGISIGSFTDSGGVSNITVINCTINGADNGIRIKSDNDRGGLVQNISYMNIGITNVDFPIQVYAYYNEFGTPSSITPAIAAGMPVGAVTNGNRIPIFRNITFSNITATSVSGFPIGIIWARTEIPATNIIFNKVRVTGDRSFDLYNVYGAQFIDCNLAVSATLNTFSMFDGHAVITNSVPTNTLFSFNGLTANGYNNSIELDNGLGATSDTNVLSGPLTLLDSTFRVTNNVVLSPNNILNFTVGTNVAQLAIAGNLALGGTVNIFGGSGFGIGTYTLMTYTGTLSGNLPTLGSVPLGFNYALDTSSAGLVNLIVSPNSPPAAPLGLTAVVNNGVINLNWSPVAAVTGYNVKRSTVSGGPYTTIAPGITTTTYGDTQVTNFTTYYYVVSALNGAGEGTNSTEVSATPVPSQLVTVTTNVLNDVFSSSTLNSASPAPPGAVSTSYELVSSKSWSPAPGIGAGDLRFGIAATTSGEIQAQALFANPPITLASVGESVSLVVTFTNTSGLLTQSGTLGFGLYNSGGNFPVTGGLNGTATTNSTSNAANNAQMWAGYVSQIAFTGGSSRIMTRPAQTTGTLANNDQDLVTSSSGSSSYNNPPGATVGASVGAVALTTGNVYTELVTITLTGVNTLAITNSLYSGTDTNGTLMSQFGGVASGATYLTNAFDALAIGWRATASTSPTTIDVNNIAINTTQIGAYTPSLVPTNIVFQLVGNELNLSWPADHFGWRLQCETNLTDSNWITVPGSTNIISTNFAIGSTNGSLFFRMIYP